MIAAVLLACRGPDDAPRAACLPAAWAWDADNDTGDAEASFHPEDPSIWLERFATPGDVDGDGAADLVADAPDAPLERDDFGAGKVLFLTRIGRTVGGGVFSVSFVTGAAGMGLGGPVPLGDLDGDGLADVGLGGGSTAIAVLGRASWADLDVSAADATAASVESGGRLGDMDGDGADDWLLVGADAAWVVSGPAVAGSLVLPDDALLSVRTGAPARIHPAGDVDGDGLADLVAWNTGTSSIILATSPGGDLATAESARIEADDLAPVGDVDGDGIADLAGGVGRDVGLWLGRTDWQATRRSAIFLDAAAVLPAGDLDGDGRSDLVVQGEDRLSLVFGRTSWDRVEDDVRFAPSALTGDLANVLAGYDFDGDGLDDLAIGAPQAGGSAGVVAVYLGEDAWDADLDLSAADARFVGTEQSWFGTRGLYGGADVDGDGCDDLIFQTFGYRTGLHVAFGQPRAD